MAVDNSQVETLLAQLQEVGASFKTGMPGARERLMKLGQSLVSSLELPSEAIMRIGWAEPARSANCRTAIDLKLFEYLKESDGNGGITAKALAEKCNADVMLIERMMRHLAAMNVVKEVSEGTYVSDTVSKALTETRFRDGVVYLYDIAGLPYLHLPKYLKETGYKMPTEVTNGPFQAAHGTDLSAFAYMDKTSYIPAFNNYMSAYREGKPSWVDEGFYPIAERLVDGFDSTISDVFLVDVGGGKGHDLEELKSKHPDIPGRLILQDREIVVNSTSSSTFEAQPHDFFTPQTVPHARAYHLHSIFHNWSDDECVRILEQLRPAMKPGYSRLLLNEIVVPLRDASWPVTAMDQLMMVLAAVQERTEAHLAGLFRRAGFRITRVYSYEMGQESLVEAELDTDAAA